MVPCPQVCAAALIAQHAALLVLVALRHLPSGALLALLAAPFELRHALSILGHPPPAEPPSPSLRFDGSMLPFVPSRTWPLWYVAAAGWHAVTFGYWLLLGLGLSWGGRCLRAAAGLG